MNLNEPLLMELEHELNNTRKALERVDESKFDWKPHEKSMTYGRLASHIAEVPGWMEMILGQDMFEMESGGQAFNAKTSTELLTTFDDGFAKAKEMLRKATNDQLMAPWVMKVDGNTIIDMPRLAVIRAWVFSHLIHHRGQLTVYMRLNDTPVPALYGPSADEQG